MPKILVTGGAGNVASGVIHQLLKNPSNHVIVVDNLTTGSATKLPPRSEPNWQFIKADANDHAQISAIMLAHRFDYVFHYAAVVGVARTLNDPISVLHDIDGIKNVLELSKNTLVKRVFYSSSSEVYGEPVSFPQHEETTPLNSRLPYAVVKNVGEAFFKSYEREHGLAYTIFRFFNTYGPNQSEDFVIAKFLAAALADRDITIYGDGSQTRTFCYIDDNAEVTRKILEDNLCVNETINIGNDNEMSILELAQRVIAATGSKSKIVHLPALAEGDMTRRLPDITKMRSVLGRELTSLEDGLAEMIKFAKRST